ncbi:MAG TPA: fused MFS/spermidine synthase [Anaerolineae bacterium]|nr:fused MFS/spermidine synthase [Anaerolineae bacterium]
MNAKRTLLLIAVFVGGMSSLGVELTAARLLDPFFGNSLIIWAVLIGMVLLYLTVGYYVGGKWADRKPYHRVLYQITAWSAFLIGVIPFVARPVLLWSVQGFAQYSAGILAGSLFGVIALFSVPITLLGCVSPFAIRLSMEDEDVASSGNVAGGLYALSTVGSLVGTFLPVLILIPNIGTRSTFMFFSFTLLAVSLIGLFMEIKARALPYLLMPAVLILLLLLLPGGIIKPIEYGELLYETESAYNYIQVVEWGDEVWLKLNEGQGLHSIYDPNSVLVGGIWDYFLIAPYFNNPPYTADQVSSLALVGSAAGTVPKQYTAVYGPIPIDGAEIDPEIIRVGREYFDMNEPNFNAVAQDGRYFLVNSSEKYDVIAIDAYRPPYIPFHLTTQEFFRQVREHLTENGVVAINVGRTRTDWSLVEVLASTLKAEFPNVYLVDLAQPGQDLINVLVVATNQPTKLENLAANATLMNHPILQQVADNSIPRAVEFTNPTVAFTDDKAPVEQVVHGLILSFVAGQ